jgi:hypothetical protein
VVETSPATIAANTRVFVCMVVSPSRIESL